MRIIVAFFLCTITNLVFAQVITSDPSFPLDRLPVIINFYSDQGSAGLSGYQGDVYAHTGVITDKSASPGDWKYVKTLWGENKALSSLERQVMELFYVNGLKQYEIAEHLKLSKSKVCRIHNKVLQDLKSRLEKEQELV